MTITLRWDDDAKSVLRVEMDGNWNWKEMLRSRQEIYRLMDESPSAKVYMIVHFLEGMRLPPGMNKHFGTMTSYSHPKGALTVLVGANGFMKTTLSGLGRMVRATGRRVDFEHGDTLDEARQIIAADQRKRGL